LPKIESLIASSPENAGRMRPDRLLRLVQVANILLIAGCFFVKRMGTLVTHDIAGRHWIVIIAAIWSAVSGFTMQRKINNTSTRPQKASRSTPLSRWKAGHLLRLSSAAAVGLWALVLHFFAGPDWIVNALFALSVLLLLIWRPGSAPAAAQP
jgi:hypothetical protein